MTLERERMLLSLSLELAAANENLAALDAFDRYLSLRFQPASSQHRDLEANAPETKLFSKRKIFHAEGKKFFFLMPLTIPVFFELEAPSGEAPNAHELECLERMVRFFREKVESHAELKGLTYTDDLTGLYNQRYLELVLERELSLAKRNNTVFSVLFLDLDHFKNVNDSHGHLIGSRLLYEVGVEIKKTLRDSDISFRYGGDEFVMILSHTDLAAAITVAERIRVKIEKKRFLVRERMEIRLTASIGVASVPEHAATKQEILKAADEALYGVKKAVRNRVIAATSTARE
jgi:diguanylate cyclase (GGDEF)-like protein